ncbi:APC family permease [Kitasatospora sp. NPDC048365]|uniref:APC family permease n=1 Tax=Kitasatospora sp. NPDC048365 TaxID=3364050 RepID=UPI00371F5A65
MTTMPVGQSDVRWPQPKRVRLLALVALIFFSVSGGAYGIEELFSTSGPGMAVLLIIVTPLIYSVPHALVCAELGTAIPVEGGYYHWVKRGLGRFWAFQQGVLSWVCSFVDMALYPVLFTSYLQSLVGAVAPGEHILFTVGNLRFDLNWMICVGVIVVFTLLNLLGAGWVGESSVAFALICLTPMLVLTAIGGYHLVADGINPISSMTASQDQSTWNAFGAGLFIVMWNYCGWDSVSNVAGEMENPRKHLPKALGISVVLIMVGYLLPSIASLAVGADGETGWQSWEAGSFSEIAKQLAGPWLQISVTIGGMFAAVAMFSALLAANSRLPLALSRDGYLPGWLSKESKRYKAPIASIVGSSVIYAMFCLSSFTDLVVFDVFLTNIGILLEVAALIALRIKAPQMARPYRIPGGWWSLSAITASLLAVCVWAAWQQYADEGTKAVTYSLAVVGGSLLLYPLLSRRKAARAAAEADAAGYGVSGDTPETGQLAGSAPAGRTDSVDA